MQQQLTNEGRGGSHAAHRGAFRRPEIQRISLAWFAQWGGVWQGMVAAGSAAGEDTTAAVKAIHDVRPYLEILGNERAIALSLPASRPLMWDLLREIYAITGSDTVADEFRKRKDNIAAICARLNVMLDGELSVQPNYYVSPKRAFDVNVLISAGAKVFADTTEDFSHDEVYDFEQAGKCLAFEVPTAAGFHIFRAVESVLRRYYSVMVGTLPKPKARAWGAYIKGLKDAPGVDGKVVVLLEQIKDLYRNPIIHPEARIDMKEALSLVGIAESVTSAMIRDMKAKELAAKLMTPDAVQPSEIGELMNR